MYFVTKKHQCEVSWCMPFANNWDLAGKNLEDIMFRTRTILVQQQDSFEIDLL